MKKLLLSLGLFLSLSLQYTQAVPAHKGVAKLTQPDGTTISIRLHGDEYLSFNTTEDGYSVVKDQNGFYVYAQLDANRQLVPTAVRAHDAVERKSAELAYLSAMPKYLTPDLTATARQQKAAELELREQTRRSAAAKVSNYDYNNFRGLIILVEFNDCSFSRSDYADLVKDMVNKENYTGYDTSKSEGRFPGSVRDYFSDNSGGLFKPQFDVIGPVKVNRSQYYVNKTTNAAQLTYDAVTAADALVNYKNYDRDGDSMTDMIFFIFAGLGANIEGNDSRLIWPHAGMLHTTQNRYIVKDNVYLGRYACSTELHGTSEWNVLDGIGTICHEFSHVLGLPDTYDTDYEKSNGQSNHPAEWDIMAGGSYLNYSRTPAGYNLLERYGVGFAQPTPLNAVGSYSLEALSKNGQGFRLDTPVKDEFFLLENRQKSEKWDAYLPSSGMLVFRVDSTNKQVWSLEYNSVNQDPTHNYFELVRAKTNTSGEAKSSDCFPGSGRVTELTNVTSPGNLKSWAGKPCAFGLKNIKMANGIVSFDLIDVNIITNLTLPEKTTIGVGTQVTLDLVREPETAKNVLTWTSGNNNIATVDQEGTVKGIAAGTTTITVTSDNGISASCEVTVVAYDIAENIAALKTMDDDKAVVLNLTNAQVLFSNKTVCYIHDASGGLQLMNAATLLNTNDLLNGPLIGKKKVVGEIAQFTPLADQNIIMALAPTAGDAPQPRPVWMKDLTDNDIADLITLTNAQLISTTYEGLKGIFAVEGDTYVRLYNPLQIKNVNVPSDYSSSRFDATGILLTRAGTGGKFVKELALMKSPEKTSSDGISTVKSDRQATGIYTLDGRRTDNLGKPGIYLIRQGNDTRKIMVK